MKKFAVFSGFLGSGKTTAMIALSKYFDRNIGKAALISNDLGSRNLADNKLAGLAGCNASELTGDCICYQTDNLVARLDRLFDDAGCDLVISDIPGFGIGALDHVYHTLNKSFHGRFELAPFTVLVEPETVDILRSEVSGDKQYILNAQLMEADLIVLNKCDLLDPVKRAGALSYLSQTYPHAQTLAISAINGEGLDMLCKALTDNQASLRLPDLGYGGERFQKAMGQISEFYMQYYATVCCNDFDGNSYLIELAETVRRSIGGGNDIPHLKLLAYEPDGDYGKADFLGVQRPVELAKSFSSPCTHLAVMLNASAFCPGEELDRIISDAVELVSRRFDLELFIFQKECFGMDK